MPSDLLYPDKIKANLKTRRIGRKILVFSSTSSTNDIAAEYAKNDANDGLVIFAEEQSAGRGRAGAKWHSNRAESVLCSIVLADCNMGAELLCLTCAVAAAEAIGKAGSTQAKIKWPNDIMLNGKKVAGILIEKLETRNPKSEIVSRYVIGMGINCHQRKDSFPAELHSIATSLDMESQTACDRIALAKRLLTSVDHWLEVAIHASQKVIDQWRNLSVQLGHRITLLYNGIKFAGNCIGIDPDKGLILQLDTGGVRMFSAAHTRILK